MTNIDYKKAANFWKEKERVEMPKDMLEAAVKLYLLENPVGALATGAEDFVRCTPLECNYHNELFWIFTEGGEKFVGLEKNKNVSLAFFDNKLGFENLKSVQVTGVAEVIEPMSDWYVAFAMAKNIPVKTLQKLADEGHPMHLICIKPTKMDVLFSEFKKMGYDSRQVLEFTNEPIHTKGIEGGTI